ncbi:chloride transporter, ClC family [Trichuris suis]|nr:chloride transporter, ClC family [Trichuris suis]
MSNCSTGMKSSGGGGISLESYQRTNDSCSNEAVKQQLKALPSCTPDRNAKHDTVNRVLSLNKKAADVCAGTTAKHLTKLLVDNIRSLFSQDWLILIALGVSVAVLSFSMDLLIGKLTEVRNWLYRLAAGVHLAAGIFTWIALVSGMTLASVVVSHYISPPAIGSGIPEIKTILRGVVLKEYLSFITLVSKTVGLTISLSSGLPIGKEGPMVHIGSIVASVICKSFGYIAQLNENRNRQAEMIAAGCAVGVACTFGAPIGGWYICTLLCSVCLLGLHLIANVIDFLTLGVLFSIEVTSVHFALRNYWRGFFSAVFSAIVYGFLVMLLHSRETVSAYCPTAFSFDTPLKAKQLVFYAALGVICGILGVMFVVWYKISFKFILTNVYIRKIVANCRYTLPLIVSILVAIVTLPNYGGKVTHSLLTSNTLLEQLFSNFTWGSANSSDYDASIVETWSPVALSFYSTLVLFVLYYASAALGRLLGECLAQWLPNVNDDIVVIPGSYAVVGAAAFTGAVTQTVSTAMIIFELTGQIVHMVPVLLGVALANLIATYLYPSVYDIGIHCKKLPYLPNLLPTSSAVHRILVRDFMITDVKYLTLSSTYKDIRVLLDAFKRVRTFPLVNNEVSKILIGEISRVELVKLLSSKLLVAERKEKRKRWRRKRLSSKIAIPKKSRQKSHSITKEPPRRSALLMMMNFFGSCSSDMMPHVVLLMSTSETIYELTKAAVQVAMLNESLPKKASSAPKRTGRKNKSANSTFSILLAQQKRFSESSTESEGVVEAAFSIRGSVIAKMEAERSPTQVQQQQESEIQRLNDVPDYKSIALDSAPFQLVECSSLFKAHAVFSLLNLQRAYVTSRGRLIGLVTLQKLREAVERVRLYSGPESGHISSSDTTWVCDYNDSYTVFTNTETLPKAPESSDKQSSAFRFSFTRKHPRTAPVRRCTSALDAEHPKDTKIELQHTISYSPSIEDKL